MSQCAHHNVIAFSDSRLPSHRLLLCLVDNCRYSYTFNIFTLQIYDILFTLSIFADKISSFQAGHKADKKSSTRMTDIVLSKIGQQD